MAETHDPSMGLDTVRAYHYGPRFLVELDIVMAEGTPLRESHDCGVLLQHKIEALASVERCFVHIDYQASRGGMCLVSPFLVSRALSHAPFLPSLAAPRRRRRPRPQHASAAQDALLGRVARCEHAAALAAGRVEP